MNNPDELYHHGVRGMRWGVRKKYQSFSGSYTKAGVKRFNESDKRYRKYQNEYKTAKKEQRPKYERQTAKAKMKQAKRDMKKDYKHLKLDKMGDKGKIRYAKGERIRANNKVERFMGTASGLVLAGATFLKGSGALGDKAYAYAVIGSATTIGASYVYSSLKKRPNNELRAYYSHTSNYK